MIERSVDRKRERDRWGQTERRTRRGTEREPERGRGRVCVKEREK